MKTQQEIEKMKEELSVKISAIDEKLNKATNEFSYNIFKEDEIRLTAQYNILLEVLK